MGWSYEYGQKTKCVRFFSFFFLNLYDICRTMCPFCCCVKKIHLNVNRIWKISSPTVNQDGYKR